MTDIDTHTKNAAAPAVEPSRAGRRRFLGKGVKAAPFFITLASQPALGDICYTPSRAISKNTSLSQHGKDGICQGAISPDNYKLYQDSKAAPYYWPDSKSPSISFHSLFLKGSSPQFAFTVTPSGEALRDMTLGEVLTIGSVQDTHLVAAHLIAAYLNTKRGSGTSIAANVMTDLGILAIWSEYVTQGYYEPTAGVHWDGVKIVFYLKSNGIVG